MNRFEHGTALGRYLLIDRLGAGGMGVVYAAFDPELDRKVAIKLVRGDADREGQARLIREAQALARVVHPNVVSVYDVGCVEEQVFIAMELVRGGTLSAWISEEPRSAEAILAKFLQAGRGLASVHEAGLVHRDFKPDNVMVAEDGRVLVMDFGVVRASGQAEPAQGTPGEGLRLTESGYALGTPAYMAPEQHTGGQIDARTDQFGFCVALWEAVYGEAPFAGDTWAKRAEEVIAGRLREPKNRAISARLHRALVRGLSAAPAERWPSMGALLGELGHGPWLTRGRAFTAAGAIALAGLVLAGVSWRQGHNRVTCQTGAARLAGIWDPARKDEIRAAFTKTGKPYAEYTFRSVERVLDKWTAEWSQMVGDNCEATWVRHEQSGSLMDLRSQCLEDRRRELQALSDLYVTADVQVLDKALDAAATLDPLVGCANVLALQHDVAPPPENIRLAVDAQRTQLAAARALHASGKYAEANALATQILEASKPLAYVPLTASALSVLGSEQLQLGQVHEAEATLEDSIVAAESCGDDAVASHSMVTLGLVVGQEMARREEGHKLLRHADAIIQRRHGDRVLEGTLHYDDGEIYLDQGNYPLAEREFQRALELRTNALGADDPVIAFSLDGLASVAAQQGRYEEALKLELRALAICEKSVGSDHPSYANQMNNVGVTLEALGRFDEAHDYQLRALRIREAVLPKNHRDLADSHANLGLLLDDQGKFEEALVELRRALEIREQALGTTHPKNAELMDYIAASYLALKRYPDAFAMYQKGLGLVENVTPPHPMLGEMLDGEGQALLGMDKVDEAMPLLSRALEVREMAHAAPIELGDTQFAMARALVAKDPKRSRELAEKARENMKLVGPRGQEPLAEIEAWLAKH